MNTRNEELFTIGRIFSEKQQAWLPALKDIKEHDIDPAWVAAILYLVYDRYMSCIDDGSQINFSKKTLELFNLMRKDGYSYIERLNKGELE